MKLQDVALTLSRIGVTSQYLIPTRLNQMLIPCPLAKWTHKKRMDGHPSCSIRFGDPASPTLFNCFSCHESGKLWDLVHTVGSFSNNQALVELGLQLLVSDEPTLLSRLEHATQSFDAWVLEPKRTTLRVLNENVLENYPQAWGIPRAQIYLTSRRVTRAMAEFWDLRWHAPHNRVIFPVRDRKGQLVGAVGRAIFDETQPKYYNFFGFEAGLTLGGLHKVMGRDRVAVVEGFHDVMNVWYWNQLAGLDTVCTFTSKTADEQSAQLQRLDAGIIYLYDQDDAGDKGWAIAQKKLEPVTTGLKRVCWHNKRLDVGDMDRLQYGEILREIE